MLIIVTLYPPGKWLFRFHVLKLTSVIHRVLHSLALVEHSFSIPEEVSGPSSHVRVNLTIHNLQLEALTELVIEGCDLIRQRKTIAAELARWSERLVREERLAMYLQHTGVTCRRRLAQMEREKRTLSSDTRP